MNKFKILFFSIIFVLLLIGLFSERHAIACETVQYSDYEQLAPNIYAQPRLKNKKRILLDISEARNRVNTIFGDMESTPKIVLVSSKGEAAKFGANSTASAHYTPWGTCIVLAPKGQNIDVAAHELTHAEVGYRIGWFTHLREIPIWFNEGVALIVDYRKPFLLENIELNKDAVNAVKKLEFAYEFFGGANTHENYLASRLAVKNVKPSELYEKLELIRNGENFDSVFKM